MPDEVVRRLVETERLLAEARTARDHWLAIAANERAHRQKLQSTVAELEQELSSLKGGIFNLCNGDKLLEDADNNLCILESYIEKLKGERDATAHVLTGMTSVAHKAEAENKKLALELLDTKLALASLQDKVLAAFDPKLHAPNAIQTNPGDENY